MFWILVVAGVSCAVCSAMTLGVMGLGLIAGDDVSSSRPRSGGLPTGNTPDLYPGGVGWLPSGRGVPIPEARVVDGRPEGLWWHWQTTSASKMNAGLILFLADGTRATNPRLGGGLAFDLEGQRAQRGSTGVGTFEVNDGKLVQHGDGYTSTDDFETGSDRDGDFFKTGAARHMPLAPPTEDGLIGTWGTPGGKFVFNADGTYESGLVDVGRDYTLAAGSRGRWLLDGYLIQFQPNGGPSWISIIGATGDRFIVIGSSIYDRK